MKNYILTERQIKEIVDQPMIKKGIALKISDDKGEYYKSVLKEFVDEEEYNDWKDNLDETMSVIGEMDIEDESDVLKEENSKINPKKKALNLIGGLVKKKYPFIKEIKISENPGEVDSWHVPVNVIFDLNEFYEYSNTFPQEKRYLKTIDEKIKSLDEPQSFLLIFTDYSKERREEYGWKFNVEFNDLINTYYKRLPKYMVYTQFEDISDEELINLAKDPTTSTSEEDFYVRWKKRKEPVEFEVDRFEPIINKEKLRKYFEE